MILDRNEAMDIEMTFPTIPNPDSAVVRVYTAGGLEMRYHRNAELMGSDVVIASPYSLTVHFNGRYIFAVSIERDDLRTMSPMIGIPLRELQEEYGVKGFYGEPKISLYGEGEKESLGVYQGVNDEEEIIRFLLSVALDTVDEIAEPVLVQKAR